MLIEILNIKASTESKGTRKWKQLEVSYRDDQGRVTGKKLMSFSNKEVFEALAEAQTGDVFDIQSEKDGQYYNWVAAEKKDKGTMPKAASSAPIQAAANRFESPEERVWRQRLIVRQSCLSNAIEYLNGISGEHSTDDVKRVAQEFITFIFDGAAVEKAAGDDEPAF